MCLSLTVLSAVMLGFNLLVAIYVQCRWHRFDEKVLCDLNKNLKNLKFFLEQPSVRLEAATTIQNADSGYKRHKRFFLVSDVGAVGLFQR